MLSHKQHRSRHHHAHKVCPSLHKSQRRLRLSRTHHTFTSIDATTLPQPRELLQLQQQQFLTTQHAETMLNLGKHKFPSSFWTISDLNVPHTTTTLASAVEKDSIKDDDFYALLARNTTYLHAQVYVPTSIDSQLFLPKHMNRLSNPVSMEHVNKTISYPLELLFDTNTQQLLPTPIDIPENSIHFTVDWATQRTQMNIGIDAYRLDLYVTVPTSFHVALLNKMHQNGNTINLTEDLLNKIIVKNDKIDFLTTLFQKYKDMEIPAISYGNMVSYHLVGTYGESLRDGQSIDHYDFIPLFLSTLHSFHKQQHPPHIKNIFHINNTAYDVLWYTAYALSHPSNWLYDRIMVELMGHEIGKQEWNDWVQGM